MTPKEYHAKQLAAHPDHDLKLTMDTIAAASKASDSQTRHDRVCDDGSIVVVTSFQGSPAVVTCLPPPPPPPNVAPPPAG